MRTGHRDRWRGYSACNFCPTDARGLKETGQLSRSPELRDGLQFLEYAGESIRQAPQGARLEGVKLRIEIEVMDRPGEVPRHLQFRLDERPVYDQPSGRVGQLTLLPELHALDHGLKVALHLIHAVGKGLQQVEVLAVRCGLRLKQKYRGNEMQEFG